ncbi:MAG: tripartite tricarboxylate transporter substrate binding protein [Proteobacteria bacterium]|nr:tripartite tricarboxylate transporter substrate binding protein [Pseudomonadota bacterium]
MTQRWKCLLVAALAAAAATAASADDAWPTRPIHFIIPFPAGGQLDVVSRMIAERVAPALGQPIVVEAKPGADGNLATEQVAKAAPDGYTWLAASPPTAIQPAVRPKTLRYDPLRDFAPVAFIGTSPFLFVVPASLPVKTLTEFVAYAKAHPGELSYAGSSFGTVVHLASETFKHDAGIGMEMINYKGQPDAIADLLSGRVQFMTLGAILAEPQVKAGKLRPLAVLDAVRFTRMPDVPTAKELGYPDLVMSTWFGILVPAATPPAIVARINAEVMKVLADPAVAGKLRDIGVDPAAPNTPADFGRFLRDDVARWRKSAADAHVNLD